MRLTEKLNELMGHPNSLVFHISTNLRVYKAIFIPLQLRVPEVEGRR